MNPRRQTGFSLTELLVAVALSAGLVLALSTQLSRLSLQHRIHTAVAEADDTAQFAAARLEERLQLAGLAGGADWRDVANPDALTLTCRGGTHARVPAWPNTGAPLITGISPGELPCPLPSGIGGDAGWMPATDILISWHAEPEAVSADDSRIQLLTDRVRGRLYRGADTPDGYQRHKLALSAWYVARRSTLSPGQPALRRQILSGNVIRDEEVIAGVEMLQVQLGLDTSGDGLADTVADAGSASATSVWVRFAISARSSWTEPGYRDARKYALPGQATGTWLPPEPEHRRSLLTRTVRLRNAPGGIP